MVKLFSRRFRLKHPRTANGTPQQATAVVEKRTLLHRRLINVREAQLVYMPCVSQLLARHVQTERLQGRVTDAVEEQPLFFPSEVDTDLLDLCEPGVAEIEAQLREGQMRDALDQLRIQLHIKTRLLNYKHKNVRHQKANTRSNVKLHANEAKIVELAEKYRAAREAKIRLSGNGSWEREWRPLQKADVRCLQEVEHDPRTHEPMTEGRRKMSWIWMAAGRDGGEAAEVPGMNDGEDRLFWSMVPVF